MQDTRLEEGLDDDDSYGLSETFSQPFLSPSDDGWLSFAPWYSGYADAFDGQPTLNYGPPIAPPAPSSGGTFYSDSLPSPLPGDSSIPQTDYDQVIGGNYQRTLQPRPASFPASTHHPPISRDMPARRSPEKSLAIQPKQSAGGKKKGREGPLPEETRIMAARTRANGSCLYHLTRKTACGKGPTTDPSGICTHCAETGRPCHRLSPKYKEALIQHSQLTNNTTLDPLLAQAGMATLEKQLRFQVEVYTSDGGVQHFEVDQMPSPNRETSEWGSRQQVLGVIRERLFFELVHTTATEAPAVADPGSWATHRCKFCSDECTAEILLEEVQQCMSLHLFLRSLPKAELRASVTDQQAAKCFFISLAYLGISSFRATLKLAIESLFRVIKTHKKVQADPGYSKVRRALAALCGIVGAVARSQEEAKVSDNILIDAISGILPQAQTFQKELQVLGQGFCAVADHLPDPQDFLDEVDRALRPNASARLTVVLDGSGSESSLRPEGALLMQEVRNVPLWSSAKDGQSRTHSLHSQPALKLFVCNRPTADARRTHFGSTATSPTVSDSEKGGSWSILTDPTPKKSAEPGSSSVSSRSNPTHKRARSDSLRIGLAKTEWKKSKSPK